MTCTNLHWLLTRTQAQVHWWQYWHMTSRQHGWPMDGRDGMSWPGPRAPWHRACIIDEALDGVGRASLTMTIKLLHMPSNPEVVEDVILAVKDLPAEDNQGECHASSLTKLSSCFTFAHCALIAGACWRWWILYCSCHHQDSYSGWSKSQIQRRKLGQADRIP